MSFVVAVKDVVLKLKPLLTKDKLLVSVAAGIKMKDLQVTKIQSFFSFISASNLCFATQIFATSL